jgi:predicted dinucleotide-binding enzyme
MKITFIGIGNVGFSIADNLQKLGYEIIVGSNNDNSRSLQNALIRNPKFKAMKVQESVDEADIIFLATPYQANESVLSGIKFNGKTLIDCTNPIKMGERGLEHGLNSEKSGSEVVQVHAKDAKVVKAFSIYGYENFVDSSFPKYSIKPTMLICGNFIEAKAQASKLIEDLGFISKDTGDLSQALHLEHMTLLWVKMVRMNKHNPHFVWAYLDK